MAAEPEPIQALDAFAAYHEWIFRARAGGIGHLNAAAAAIIDSVARVCENHIAFWNDNDPDVTHAEIRARSDPMWAQTLTGLQQNVAEANATSPFVEFQNWAWALYPVHDDPEHQAWFDGLPNEAQNVINTACDRIDQVLRYEEAVHAGEADDIPLPRTPLSRDDVGWTERLRMAQDQLAAAQAVVAP